MHAQTEQTGLSHAASSLVIHGQGARARGGGGWARQQFGAPYQQGHLTGHGHQPQPGRWAQRGGCDAWQPVRHKPGCRESGKVRMVPSAGQAVECTEGACWTPGSHPEPVGKSSFLLWLSNGTPKTNSQKKCHGLFFPPFFLLSTHSFNECLLEREREKEKGEYGMRCVWQGLGKTVSEVERQGRTAEGRGKSWPLWA